MKQILRVIDSISEYSGKSARWLVLGLTLVIVVEVTARYCFSRPTIWVHTMMCMLLGAIVALGLSYTHRHHGHVRIDVIYSQLNPKAKAIIDSIGFIIFFLPIITVLIYAGAKRMFEAWEMNEVWMISYWYVPTGPSRTILIVGLFLFLLQGIATFIRDIYFLIRNKRL